MASRTALSNIEVIDGSIVTIEVYGNAFFMGVCHPEKSSEMRVRSFSSVGNLENLELIIKKLQAAKKAMKLSDQRYSPQIQQLTQCEVKP